MCFFDILLRIVLRSASIVHGDINPANILFEQYDYKEVHYIIERVSTLGAQLFLIPVSLNNSYFQQRQHVYAMNSNVKLTNFHCACYGREQAFSDRWMSHPHYRAMKIEQGRAPHYSNDVWSLGCVMFEVYSGRKLYEVTGLDMADKTCERALRRAYVLVHPIITMFLNLIHILFVSFLGMLVGK